MVKQFKAPRWPGLAVPLASLALLVGACSGGSEGPEAEAYQPDRWCPALSEAIDDVEIAFQAGTPVEIGAEFLDKSGGDLLWLANSLPDDAPVGVTDLLEVSAGIQKLLAEGAKSDDPQGTVRAGIDPLFERMDTIDVDPAEEWVNEQCGIERVGIMLRITDDDRASGSAAAESSADDTTTVSDG